MNAFVIGYVGRLAKEKGVEDLLDAWRRVSAAESDIHLLIVGPRDDRDPADRAILEAAKTDDRVHFLGEDWNTPPLYCVMDCLCLPTYREGLPVTCLEAAAMRLPIVATDIAGVREIVSHEVSGLLVPTGSPSRLAEALKRYVEDARLRSEHGRAARARVIADFTPERIWRELHAVYMTIVHQYGVIPHAAEEATSSNCQSALPRM